MPSYEINNQILDNVDYILSTVPLKNVKSDKIIIFLMQSLNPINRSKRTPNGIPLFPANIKHIHTATIV